MLDLQISSDSIGVEFDLAFLRSDLVSESGLRNAVLISLFTDARVDAEEIPTGDTDPRGWFGDLVSGDKTDKIGSKLWLLKRKKQTDDIPGLAEEYCEEALGWMIDDNIAKSVQASAAWIGVGKLGIAIEIQKPDGKTFKFETAWLTEAAR